MQGPFNVLARLYLGVNWQSPWFGFLPSTVTSRLRIRNCPWSVSPWEFIFWQSAVSTLYVQAAYYLLILILESQIKKLRGGTPSKTLVAPFSWLQKLIKKGSLKEPLSKQQLLSSLVLPKEAKSRIIDKVWSCNLRL